MDHPIINDSILLPSWQLEDLRLLQESQADVFRRVHTMRRFLRALQDHVIQEKRLALEHQQMAEEHDNRCGRARFSPGTRWSLQLFSSAISAVAAAR